ncbi:hypothetical protein Tco_0889976 [Tanacetum coccineum]
MFTYSLCQRTTGYHKVHRNELWLMSMLKAKHQNRYVNMAWFIVKWVKRKRVGSQRESMICCGQFITKIAKRVNLLTDEVLDGLSAPIYSRPLDTTTLRELIASKGRLIVEEPAPNDLIVDVPRPPHHSIFYLYDRMGCMDIRKGELERMSLISHIIMTDMHVFSSIWMGTIMFHCKESTHHPAIMSHSSRMRSSVEMTHVDLSDRVWVTCLKTNS